MGENDYRKPILMLILLSPLIAELLSSSMTIPEIINPVSFMLLVFLYGFGALIIRELSVGRENKWVFIIFMGMVYGIAEEGLACKSFYNPEWPDLDVLAYYGRYMGINMLWALHLIIYHAIVSIAIPIAITELVYRGYSGERWVSNKKLCIAAIVYAVTILVFNLVLPYSPSLLQYSFSFILMIVLGCLAVVVKQRKIMAVEPRKKILFVLGFLWMLIFFLTFFGFASLGINPIITAIVAILVNTAYLFFFSIQKWDMLTDRDKMDIAYSPLWFLIVLWLISLNIERTVVGIIFAIIHIRLRAKIS